MYPPEEGFSSLLLQGDPSFSLPGYRGISCCLPEGPAALDKGKVLFRRSRHESHHFILWRDEKEAVMPRPVGCKEGISLFQVGTPATQRSTTRWCCKVPQGFSIRPLACGDRTVMGLTPRMSGASPNCISSSLVLLSSSARVSLRGFGEKKMVWASE